jgi:hypothetical protein
MRESLIHQSSFSKNKSIGRAPRRLVKRHSAEWHSTKWHRTLPSPGLCYLKNITSVAYNRHSVLLNTDCRTQGVEALPPLNILGQGPYTLYRALLLPSLPTNALVYSQSRPILLKYHLASCHSANCHLSERRHVVGISKNGYCFILHQFVVFSPLGLFL